MLSKDQIEGFHDKGYITVLDAATPAQITQLLDALEGWIEESRDHNANFGETTRFVRLREHVIEMPEAYQDDSFFGVQGRASADSTPQDLR